MSNLLKQENYHYVLDYTAKPIAEVEPDQEITVCTINSFGAALNSQEDLERNIKSGKHHPLSGPVFVKGAEKDKAIAIDIKKIELASFAYQCISNSTGFMKGCFTDRNFKKIPIVNDKFDYDGFIFDTNPVLGVIGLACPEETRSGRTGMYGGNLDLTCLTEGSILYLPVAKAGACIFLGDLHAFQGDGELSGIALEASGKVTFKAIPMDFSINGPVIVKDNDVFIVGYGSDLNESITKAVVNTVELLSKILDIEEIDAYLLAGAFGHITLGHATGKVVSTAIRMSNDIVKFPGALRSVDNAE